MRRTLVPALAVALLPFTAMAPAHAGVSTPSVITPMSGPVTFTFELTEPMTAALLEIRRTSSATVVASQSLGDLAAGKASATWNARTAADEAAADGSYVATLRAGGSETPVADQATVRVNLVAPKASTAPTISATSVFPWTDGYRDAITINGPAPTTEVGANAFVEVVNAAGTVVWSTRGSSVRWTGRTSSGSLAPAGLYRVRSRFVDADGLTGHSPTRNVAVSAKRLVTRTENDTISPRRYAITHYVGKCGKIFTPARKGKAWKKSVGVASRHKCKGGKVSGLTEAHFGAWWPNAYDVRSVKLEVVGAGHTRNKRNWAVGYVLGSNGKLAKDRRLSHRSGKRTLVSASGAAARSYFSGRHELYWGVAAFEGSRYDIKSFRLKVVYRTLVDPNARVAGAAGGVQPLG
ncbi:FlgD immunoglobulin-like domain containing protein [Mumia sp. ZJ430]|uniref:FlgD immunoglobulin-like domain containing protein n=1 Tax=Mumia sp. ZJ430 TaxID=2708083 RepID=UPI00141FB468|nr:FlgD immunoglobulin-like domain containing protein [Mumia sp. ZJ430]